GRLTSHLLRGSAAYHLYFVPLIVTYYLLWPLFSRLAVGARRDPRAAGAIAAAGLAVSVATWRGLPASSATAPLFWLGYATVGLVAAPWLARVNAVRPRQLLLGASIGLVTITAVVMVRWVMALLPPTPDPGSFPLAVVIFQLPVLAYAIAGIVLATLLVGLLANVRGMNALRDLGRRSYGVYLAHVLVLEVVVQRLLGRPASADFGSPAWVVTLIASWALCVTLTWVLIAGLARVPGLSIVAGGRPSDRALTAAPPPP
ncbi:MAG: acyltransferase family protein, partial [Candidatus Binatia bacterium]